MLPDLTREDFLAMLRSPDSPADLEWKMSPSGILEADDDGVVKAIVAVTGIVDEVDDIIIPGAFSETLQRRTPKGVWSHDVHTWVSRTDAIGELMPGDPRLPTQWKGRPWPKDAGALVVRTAFNLGAQAGRDAYSNVTFFDAGPLGPQVEWSIGYNSIPGFTKRNRLGQRELSKIDLYEYGPVLFGAMPLAGTVGTKARIFAVEHKGGPFMGAGGSTVLGDLELKVAGKEVTPSDVKNTEKLKEYWERGEGAAKIRWGEPGDFDRCVTELSKYLPPNQVKGYCANRHKGATGGWPGHAPGVEQAEADAKKAGKKAGDLDSIETQGAALLDTLEGKAVAAPEQDEARAALVALGMTDDEIEAALADDPEWTSVPEDAGVAVEPIDGDEQRSDAQSPDPEQVVEPESTTMKPAGELAVGDDVIELKSASGTLTGPIQATTTRGPLVGLAIETKAGVKTAWVPRDDRVQVHHDPHHEIKAGLAMVAERKDYPFLPGSVEERQQEIREAVRDLLLPEPDDQGNIRAYVSLDATFADYVVATLNDYSMPGPDEDHSFVIPYTITDDGEVDLGQPIPVEKQVVLVPADAEDEAASTSAADTPAPASAVPVGGMNPALTLARKVAAQAKALVDDLEAKAAAGVADLSGTHVRRIRAADAALDGALAGLGSPFTEVTPDEGKALLGEVADLFARSAEI